LQGFQPVQDGRNRPGLRFGKIPYFPKVITDHGNRIGICNAPPISDQEREVHVKCLTFTLTQVITLPDATARRGT
jgi:hypothetical protein